MRKRRAAMLGVAWASGFYLGAGTIAKMLYPEKSLPRALARFIDRAAWESIH